jgi:pyruvate carboxylase
LDPVKSAAIDFPESVVGLMRGDLGFPHRGFPEAVTRNVLKGAAGSVRTVRAGLTLPPVDFAKHIESLETQFGVPISPEKAMSSLMYPKVFSDYMKRQLSKGGALIRYLPTPVYLHGMLPNGKSGFTMTVPLSALGQAGESTEGCATIEVRMLRVHPLRNGNRTVSFLVNGTQSFDFHVKDTSGAFVFEGAMAVPGDTSTVINNTYTY